MLALVAAALVLDPLMLPIVGPETVEVGVGWTSTATGSPASPADVARAAEGKRFVFIGESHDQLAHHQAQADVVRALAAAGRKPVVLLEMLPYTLDSNALGDWQALSDAELQAKLDWQTHWGMDFALYKPVFDAARAVGARFRGVNVPRSTVRTISRQGLDALTAEQLTPIGWASAEDAQADLTHEGHRQVFEALMGGHPLSGPGMDRVYAAQVAWDVAMAHQGELALAGLGADYVGVYIVGSGHMLHGVGIQARLTPATPVLNVLCIDLTEPREVSVGVADYTLGVQRPVEADPS